MNMKRKSLFYVILIFHFLFHTLYFIYSNILYTSDKIISALYVRMCKNAMKYFCIPWFNFFSIVNLKENKMHTQWNLWSNFSICTLSHQINIPTHDRRVKKHQYEMRTVGHCVGFESYATEVSLSASVYFLFHMRLQLPFHHQWKFKCFYFWTNYISSCLKIHKIH
jgi:hypothetical protein